MERGKAAGVRARRAAARARSGSRRPTEGMGSRCCFLCTPFYSPWIPHCRICRWTTDLHFCYTHIDKINNYWTDAMAGGG